MEVNLERRDRQPIEENIQAQQKEKSREEIPQTNNLFMAQATELVAVEEDWVEVIDNLSNTTTQVEIEENNTLGKQVEDKRDNTNNQRESRYDGKYTHKLGEQHCIRQDHYGGEEFIHKNSDHHECVHKAPLGGMQ